MRQCAAWAKFNKGMAAVHLSMRCMVGLAQACFSICNRREFGVWVCRWPGRWRCTAESDGVSEKEGREVGHHMKVVHVH